MKLAECMKELKFVDDRKKVFSKNVFLYRLENRFFGLAKDYPSSELTVSFLVVSNFKNMKKDVLLFRLFRSLKIVR